MFKKILVPIESHRLAETDVAAQARKVIDVAADLAKRHGATLTLATMQPIPEPPIGPAPIPLDVVIDVETPLVAFAAEQSQRLGFTVETLTAPGAEVSSTLRAMAERIGADLIVMSSHAPTFLDYLFGSNAASTALHTQCSVFVVR